MFGLKEAPSATGVEVLLFKENVPKDEETLNAFCNALQNGDAAETAQLLKKDDYHTIYKYGIACFKRRCRDIEAFKS